MPKSHQHHRETVEMFFRLNTNTGEGESRGKMSCSKRPPEKRREDGKKFSFCICRETFFRGNLSNLSNKYNFLSPYTLSTKIISKACGNCHTQRSSKNFSLRDFLHFLTAFSSSRIFFGLFFLLLLLSIHKTTFPTNENTKTLTPPSPF